MRTSEVEYWALSVIDRVEKGQPIEDSRVEAKAEWVDAVARDEKKARQVTGEGVRPWSRRLLRGNVASRGHHMTPIELEVWQTVQAMNRAWTNGHVEQLVDYFHANIVAITPTDRHRLEGREACIAGWTAFVEQAKIVSWVERDPKVTVFGENAAVVTYYYSANVEMGGKLVELSGRDMLFMVREQGRWWAVADQFSGMPGGGTA